MDKALQIVAILVFSTIVISCGARPKGAAYKIQEQMEEKVGADVQPIIMAVMPGIYDGVPETVNLYIVNNTETEASYPANYTVEKFEDGVWAELPLQINFIMMMFYIAPQQVEKEVVSLYTQQVAYTSGSYRIAKFFYLGEEKVYAYGEFIIE